MIDRTAFVQWMELGISSGVLPMEEPQIREQRAIVDDLADLIGDGGRLWRALPRIVQRVLGPRGYAWNGIYGRDGETLRLVAAAGPPVCAELERRGGLFQSGMCWDGLQMNQTLVAADVTRWPGYVSCDSDSGLKTVAGIVSPIRDASGKPIAVFDCDLLNRPAPSDPVFFDRLFSTLSVTLEPTSAGLLVL